MHQRYVTQILDKSSVPLMAEAFHIIGIINGFGEYLMRRFTENCAQLSNFSCIDRKRVPGVTQHIERHITKTMLALELLPTTEVSIHHYFLHNTAPKVSLSTITTILSYRSISLIPFPIYLLTYMGVFDLGQTIAVYSDRFSNHCIFVPPYY